MNILSCRIGRAAVFATMGAFIYRCPDTGLKVQGWLAEDPSSADDDGTYETVLCAVCGRGHMVNPKTGKVVGDDAG